MFLPYCPVKELALLFRKHQKIVFIFQMHLTLNVLFSSWMEKLNRRGAHSSCVQLSAAAGSPASIRPIVRADFKTKVPRASRTVNVFLDEISCNLSQGIQ